MFDIVKIPKDLMNNYEDLFISKSHPIWINDDKIRNKPKLI